SRGVIALTGCLASRFCQRLLEDRPHDARSHADDLQRIYGPENVYFEVQKNGLAEQEKCNEGIVRIAGEAGGSLVGTGDVHYLRGRVLEGVRLRYGGPAPAEALERVEMELAVIDRMGFNAYFLIVWDFVKFAKENGIAVGPGRGSAAGSIVAYCLAITDVDPL